MANFNQALQKVLVNEGGWVNDPDDIGGETYKGIARKFWPKWSGWALIDVYRNQNPFPQCLETSKTLQEQVAVFYNQNFWQPIQGDSIELQAVAESIFDFAVNGGVGSAKELARIACETDKYNVSALGKLEPSKLVTSEELFQVLYTMAKIMRYINSVKKRPKSKKYFYNWICRSMNL